MKSIMITTCAILYIFVVLSSLSAHYEMGPCDSVSEIRIIPFKNEHVDDNSYNNIIAMGSKAVPCLIEKVLDTTKMPDPRKAPQYDGITVGDVSLFVLLRISGLSLEDILPDNIREEYKREGVYAYFRFVENYENRKVIQKRLHELLRKHK